MTTLVTTTDLASKLQSDLDLSTATLAVTHASGFVRAVARQTFSFVSQETVILPGLGERVLTLPERPLVVDGSNPLTVVEVGEFGGTDLTLVEDRDYSRLGNELTRGWPYWFNTGSRLMGWPYTRPLGVWAPKVQVTYSHGYATIPDDVQAMTISAAALLYDNPTGLRSISIDDYSETRATEHLGAGLVKQIRETLITTGRRRRAFSIRTA